MQIAKWIREYLGREAEDDDDVPEPKASVGDDGRADETEDDPSVYPLW